MWDHTSSILTLLYNINRDPKKGTPVNVEKLHPYSDKKHKSGILITNENVHILREAFKGHRNSHQETT